MWKRRRCSPHASPRSRAPARSGHTRANSRVRVTIIRCLPSQMKGFRAPAEQQKHAMSGQASELLRLVAHIALWIPIKLPLAAQRAEVVPRALVRARTRSRRWVYLHTADGIRGLCALRALWVLGVVRRHLAVLPMVGISLRWMSLCPPVDASVAA